jgi:hypothetical protein
MKTRKIISLALFIAVLISAVSLVHAHKSAASTAQSSESYEFEFGKAPGLPIENIEQRLFFRVKNKETGVPSSNLRAEFNIYAQDASKFTPENIMDVSQAVLLRKLTAQQEEPGLYVGRNTFTEVGSYLITAKLYDQDNMIGDITQHLHVEPKGPSPFFWVFMMIALIIGAFIASRSHKT